MDTYSELQAVVLEIEVFLDKAEEDEYMDTGEAIDLFVWVQERLVQCLFSKDRGE